MKGACRREQRAVVIAATFFFHDQKTCFIAGLVLVLAIATFATFRLKSTPLKSNPSMMTGYYRGGWLFPRRFYKVVLDEGPNGYCEFDICHEDYCSYRGYYPDGTLKEQGEVRVTVSGAGSDAEPYPDRHDVRNGIYYLPDGTVDSRVQDGTGVQTLRYPDGSLSWRLTLRNFRRIHVQWWKEDGDLVMEESYGDN